MKNFKHTVNKKIHQNFQEVIIENYDEPVSGEASIRKIEFKSYLSGEHQVFTIFVTLENETGEVQSMFRAVPAAGHQILNVEAITNEASLENIIEFINVIQKADPLPLEALELIQQHTKIRLGNILWTKKIPKLAEENNHDEAIKLALELDKNQEESIAYLLNFYADSKNEEQYYRLLNTVPETSAYYPEANQRLYEQLVSIDIPEDEDEKLALTEKKFQYAMRANLKEEAACHFAALCGESGFNPTVKNISGDPEPFIQIAKIQRKLKKENEALRRTAEKQMNTSSSSTNKTSEKPGLFNKSSGQKNTDDTVVNNKRRRTKSL